LTPSAGPIRVLRVEPLTGVAFEIFGDVIEAPRGGGRTVNDGTAVRHDDIAALELTADGGRPVLGLFRVRPQHLPFECRTLERHPLSSQAFVPVGERRFLVVVAPAGDGKPDAAATRAFVTDGRQGVNYRRGVWHHPVLALDGETDFVMMGRADDGRDCDVAPFTGGAGVRIARIPGRDSTGR
jgi:ureidoglycolate lyase